jgi:2'-5' RNA ligase
MRLFVAVNLSNDSRSRLVAIRDELRSVSKRGNFTRTENIHLTLVFIGDCTDEQANKVKAAMDEVNFKKFTLTIDHIGQFRRFGSGNTWWAGIRGSMPLEEMHRDLADKIVSKSISIDSRRYSPHMTIGRDVATKKEPWQIDPFQETVSSMDLMRSDRIDGRIVYRSIYKRGAEE